MDATPAPAAQADAPKKPRRARKPAPRQRKPAAPVAAAPAEANGEAPAAKRPRRRSRPRRAQASGLAYTLDWTYDGVTYAVQGSVAATSALFGLLNANGVAGVRLVPNA